MKKTKSTVSNSRFWNHFKNLNSEKVKSQSRNRAKEKQSNVIVILDVTCGSERRGRNQEDDPYGQETQFRDYGGGSGG